MRQIEENIRKRKASTTYSREDEDLIAVPIHPSHISQEDFQEDMYQVKSRWDVRAEYEVRSHRKLLGKILVLGRKMINGEVKRYLDPIIANQVEFNSHIANILSKTSHSDSKDMEIRDCQLFAGKLPVDAEEMLKHKKMLLEYFKGCTNVLVMVRARERSEIASLMEDEGIKVSEVEVSEVKASEAEISKSGMAKDKKGQSLSLQSPQESQVLSHLSSLKDGSLDGIFCDHILELLPSADLADLAELCHRKMRPGAHFVSNGVNPAVASLHSLSRGPDGIQACPIDPQTTKSLLESAGFRGVQIEFFNQPPDESRLSKLKISNDAPDYERDNLEIANRNIMKLNSLLFGPQSYSAIAER
ncbi:MAG TPA: hypothetical protein VN455_13385 [Methanotrichaceae archaeon]|nr:hypothetical protein [Methanotrichaceae archaeon]